MQPIGTEVQEKIQIIPARIILHRDVYVTYACLNCKENGISTPIVQTPKEPALIPGSYASAEAVAHFAVQKFVMGSPLYRQEQEWNRQGFMISRQTMSNWLIRCSEDWLAPVYGALHRLLVQHDLLHADETELQVLHEEGKDARAKSYMWLYRTSGDAEHPIVLYEYAPGRGQEYPKTFLKGFHGYLQTDGYSGYAGVDGAIRVGCWAHARRKFDEALRAVPKGKRSPTAEQGKKVEIWERRDHIGGNMFDYVDEHGFLVQKYGPHTFHTKEKALFDYMCRFEDWQAYKLCCGAVWDGKYTPTPFNYTTIDTFYPPEQAAGLKKKLSAAFVGRPTATVVEVLQHPDADIRGYAEFLFQNDYAPYTAKQWGLEPEEIDPSVLKRVPLRFSYDIGYFDDPYEVMPVHSFTRFFENLLVHPNLHVSLGIEALDHLSVKEGALYLDGERINCPVVYTGALDELFGFCYGRLPYRSLRFEWKYEEKDSFQDAPVVAYPQEAGFTRITEYKKLPRQEGKGTSYALEYPLPYQEGTTMEPYYPVLTERSQEQYTSYKALADRIPNLICCGRLADFKYYNMDQALARALEICRAF